MAGGRGDIQAGRAFVSLYVKKNALAQGLQAAKQHLNEFGSSMIGVGARAVAVSAGMMGSILLASKAYADAGSALVDMSQRTGVGIEALGRISHAAKMSGTDMETVEKSIRKMGVTIDGAFRGKKEAIKTIEDLGLSLGELNTMSPDEQLATIADALAKIEDPGEKAATAMRVFGKSGAELLPMMSGGAEGMQEMYKEAERLGLVMSTENARAAEKFGDAIDTLKSSIMGIVYQVGGALAPTLTLLLERMSNLSAEAIRFVANNRSIVIAVVATVAAIAAVGVVLVSVGLLAKLLAIAIGVFVSPITLVILAIAGLGFAFRSSLSPIGAMLKTLYTYFVQTFSGMLDAVRNTFSGIFDAIASGNLALAGQIAIIGLKLAFAEGMQAISEMVGGALGQTISLFTSSILSGDFSGAWDSVVVGMALIWDSFTTGIVTSFERVSKKVKQIWQDTIDSLSKTILVEAAKGGMFGSFFESISGVNVQDEVAKAERLKQQAAAAGMNTESQAADPLINELATVKAAAEENTRASQARFDDFLARANNANAAGIAPEVSTVAPTTIDPTVIDPVSTQSAVTVAVDPIAVAAPAPVIAPVAVVASVAAVSPVAASVAAADPVAAPAPAVAPAVAVSPAVAPVVAPIVAPIAVVAPVAAVASAPAPVAAADPIAVVPPAPVVSPVAAPTVLNAEIDRLKKELADLMAQADTRQNDNEAKDDRVSDLSLDGGVVEGSKKSTATFSAAALVASNQGAGSNVPGMTLKEIGLLRKEAKDERARLREEHRELVAAAKQGGGIALQ